MLNKKIKRTLCGLVASLCLVGSTVPVFAETVDFCKIVCYNDVVIVYAFIIQ